MKKKVPGPLAKAGEIASRKHLTDKIRARVEIVDRRKSHIVKLNASITAKGASEEEVSRLPDVEQGEIIYHFLKLVAESLSKFGFFPSVVAQVANDLGFDLLRQHPGPATIVRLDSEDLPPIDPKKQQ
jgi:hypothetical protein